MPPIYSEVLQRLAVSAIVNSIVPSDMIPLIYVDRHGNLKLSQEATEIARQLFERQADEPKSSIMEYEVNTQRPPKVDDSQLSG